MSGSKGPCPSCSSSKSARALPDDPSNANAYVEQIRQLFKERKLPDLSQTLVYKVYHLRGSTFGSHSSIVVTHDDVNFVTVELGFMKVDGKKTVYPVSYPYTKDKAKLEYCGSVEKTGYELFRKAVTTMQKFGAYDYFFNNCQNYANDFLEALKLKKVPTDMSRAANYYSSYSHSSDSHSSYSHSSYSHSSDPNSSDPYSSSSVSGSGPGSGSGSGCCG